MLDTTDTFKESSHFTKLKAGGRFAIYAFGIYLTATFTIGYLGLIIGFPLLTFPLAMLIFHPVIWVVMGIVLTATYKMTVEPLFHLVKDYINGKKASKGEKSESMDSGVDTISRKTDGSDDTERRSSSTSLDSGLGGKEFHENLDTLVHQTNRENYAYWLQQHDIAHIARAVYNYSESSDGHIFFCIPGNLESLNERLREYKNKAEQENLRIFTSVINLGGNHWVTLIIAYNSDSKKSRAYYCDSFSTDLPSPGSQRKEIELANEIKDKLFVPLTNQANELNAQGKKEMGQDVRKTAQTCQDKKNELTNVPINTDNIVSALEAVLEIGSDHIRSSKTKQQKDGYNCGIFALENAKKITDMLKAGKSFDEIDDQLKYELSSEQLIEKRKEFAKVLMEDEEWRENLKNGLLCDPPPKTETSSTSEVQHTNLVSCPSK